MLFAQNTFPSIPSSSKYCFFNEGFMKAFIPRWEGLRTHTFEVMEAMPDDQFDYQPTEEVMSFSKLFTHIGKSMDVYTGMLHGTPHKEELESNHKSEVETYLSASFDRFEQAMTQIDSERLYISSHKIPTRDGALNMSDYDIIMLMYNHTVHHKGQATTYLRLVGITPPQYRY